MRPHGRRLRLGLGLHTRERRRRNACVESDYHRCLDAYGSLPLPLFQVPSLKTHHLFFPALWFFCKQLIPSPHCIAGMVGAINPPASGSNSFQAFQSNAHGFTGTPGVCDFLILRIFSNRGIFACSKELVLSLGAVRRRRRFQVRLPMALCWLGPRLLRRRLRVAQVPVVVRRRAAGLLLRPVRIHRIPR